jgi:hypothetical protein
MSGDTVRAGAVAEEAYREFVDHPDRATAAVIDLRTAMYRGMDSPAAGGPQHWAISNFTGRHYAANSCVSPAWRAAPGARPNVSLDGVRSSSLLRRFGQGEGVPPQKVAAEARPGQDLVGDMPHLCVGQWRRPHGLSGLLPSSPSSSDGPRCRGRRRSRTARRGEPASGRAPNTTSVPPGRSRAHLCQSGAGVHVTKRSHRHDELERRGLEWVSEEATDEYSTAPKALSCALRTIDAARITVDR